MNVRISKRARQDLLEIEVKVRDEDPATADWLIERLLSGIDMLA